MEKIALLPGGFKPPHAGHYNMAKWLVANTDADSVVIKIGSKERDGITRDISLKLWDLYRKADEESNKLVIVPSEQNSPVRDVYDFIEQEAPEGSTVYLGMGEKDVEDQRFKNIGKFAEPKNIKFETVLVPPQAGGVSGTEMRGFIKDGDKESFQKYLPDHLSSEQKDEAWGIVSSLEEDFYDPRNKIYDFAKSSEWKAGMPDGPKDDIPRKGDRIGGKNKIPGIVYEQQGGKTLRVYDFDDTLAVTKGANIKIKHADGSMDTLDPAEFAVYDAQEGDKFDFTEFDKVIKDAEPIQNIISMLEKDLQTTAKVTILTARLIAYPVRRYLKSLGLDAYVVAVGSSDPNDKAKWIENHIEKGYTDILFIDDSEKNRNAVSNLKDKYPDIKLDVQDPDSIKEMIGTMNNQEKRKHAKNLKRLNKDLKKQGDQYMKVPNYLKGTLKRKLKEQYIPDKPYHNEKGHYTTSVASINNKSIPLEVMRTPDDQITGMMGRDEMKAGMVFPYDQVSRKDFHMEGCLIPLDIVFVNKGTIDTIHSDCPPCKETPCPKYSGMADNVLELPGGYCKKHNINVGDKVNFNLTESKLLNEQYIPEDAGCMQFCDPVDFEDPNNYLQAGEEQLLIIPICLPDFKPEDAGLISSYQYMVGYNNDILEYNSEYSSWINQAPWAFNLSPSIAGGFGIANENIPGTLSFAWATGWPADWSETAVLTYLVFVVTGNGAANFTWNEDAGGLDVNPNMQSYYVAGVTDCFENGSVSVTFDDESEEETDMCAGLEGYANSLGIQSGVPGVDGTTMSAADQYCIKCQAGSWPDDMAEMCDCCDTDYTYSDNTITYDDDIEGLPPLPSKDKAPLKDKPKKEPPALTKEWWKHQIKKILTEGGAAGHMAHPFNLPDVNSGKDLLNVFEKATNSLQNNPGSVKIDGVNSSIRLIDLDGEKQFVMDRGSKKELDVKGITKDDLLDRFGDGHGMVKIGGEVLDMFNKALPSIKDDLEKLGAWNDPNILFNMEYVSGKTNVQDYGSNFIAIHGLNKIESKEVQGKRKMLTKRISSEVSYDKSTLQSLLDNLAPIAKEKGFEVYGSVPTEMTKKPNFNAALSKTYTIEAGENTQTKSLKNLLDELNNIPEEDFIFMNVNNSRKKVGAVSKQVYLAILNGENVDDLFEDENDKQKAIEGFTTYLATEKLGDEVLKVLDSPMGSVENHEGVVIRDENIANVPFKITGKFILGGLVSDF